MKFLDFFAGIGGFRFGMQAAGHECAGHCEIDKYANISYAAIHQPKESEWFATDIRNVEPGELPDADCYCGGFPCQSFSIAGKRGGFDDTRGTLFFEVMRLAKVRKPRLLFLENVEGLLNHDNGRTFETIIRTLDELGYDAEWQVLNSKDFGVPQNRERVFIIGHLRGFSFREVFPIRGENEGNIEVFGYLRDTKIKDRTRILYPRGISQALRATDYKDPVKITISGLYLNQQTQFDRGPLEGVLRTLKADTHPQGILVQPVLTPDRINKRQNGRRFKENGEEMFTLTAQDKHGVMITETNGKKYIRKLTPLEYFRGQGFPDWAHEAAKNAGVSDSQRYKQAGNSVTVNVIEAIARRL
jgi:DNA (cytosine-5)-methyltransferase 1